VNGPPSLSRAAVDRDAQTRDDPLALAAAWERARVLLVEDGRALVDGTELVLVGPEAAPSGDRFYLGSDAESVYFAVAGPLPGGRDARPAGIREVGTVLSDRDTGLLVHAVGLANWHAAHPRCPRCGAPTESIRGGAVRRCTAEGSEHFPRTDPAVIMLVTDGADRCVLGRQAGWPARRFSTLAGFVEPGESAEMAVVREVAEETGLPVTDVRYSASQPWPFPASLMLGFTARTDGSGLPHAKDGELEDARWFTREQLRDGREVLLPPPVSIAWRLLMDWLES